MVLEAVTPPVLPVRSALVESALPANPIVLAKPAGMMAAAEAAVNALAKASAPTAFATPVRDAPSRKAQVVVAARARRVFAHSMLSAVTRSMTSTASTLALGNVVAAQQIRLRGVVMVPAPMKKTAVPALRIAAAKLD